MILGIDSNGKVTSPLASLFEKNSLTISREEFIGAFKQGVKAGDFNNVFDGFKNGGKYLKDLKEQVKGVKGGLKSLTEEQVGQYFDGIGKSVERTESKISSFGKKMKGFGVSIVNALAGVAISLTIQKIIDLFDQLSNSAEYTMQRIKGVFEEYSSETSSIEEYKNKIASLQDKLNDSNTSYEEAKSAREELMSIQNELFEKYGKEAEDIAIVTEAVNEQSDALDKLAQKKWEAAKTDINASGDHPIAEGFARAGLGASDNLEMIQKMMTTNIQRGSNVIGLINPGDIALLNKAKEIFGDINYQAGLLGNVTISGNGLEDLVNNYKNLLDYVKANGGGSALQQALTDSLKQLTDQYEEYGKVFDEYVLNDKILNNDAYKAQLNQIQNLYDQYTEKFAEDGAEGAEKLKQLLIDKLSDIGDSINDDSVLEYFRNLYPEIQSEIDSWEFKADIQVNNYDSELKKDKISSAKTFSTFNGIDNVSASFTPVFVDANGAVRRFSSHDLEQYAIDVLSGVREDNLNLMIGAKWVGENALNDAKNALMVLQDKEITGNNILDKLVNDVKEFSDEETLLMMRSDEYAKAASENQQTAWAEIKQAADDYGLSIEAIIDLLRELGVLKGFAYGNVNEITGRFTRTTGAFKNDSNDANYNNFRSALGTLSEKNSDTVGAFTAEQWAEVNERAEKLKESLGATTLTTGEWSGILIQVASNWRSVQEAEAEAEAEQKKLLDELEALGISKDQLDAYVKTLETLYPALSRDAEGLQAFAAAQLKVDNAVADLTSNLDDYIYKLENAEKNSADYSTAISSLAQDLTNLTGKEFTLFEAEDFISDAENLKLLKDAIAGVDGAFDQLKAKVGSLSSEIVIDVDADLSLEDFNTDYDSFISWLNNNTDVGKLNVDAGLNTENFYEMLRDLMSQSEEAAKAVQSYFDSLGWDMEFDWENIDISVPTGGLGTEDARSEKFSIKQLEAQMKIPTNFRLKKKHDTSITPPKDTGGGSSGGSGGGGGGGGGGSSKDPTEEAAKDAAESVEDAAKAIEDAAKAAIDEITKRWDEALYMMENQITVVTNSIAQKENKKELALLQGKNVRGMWKDVYSSKKYLAASYQQQSDWNARKAQDVEAELNRQIAAGAITPGSDTETEYRHQILEAQNKSQEAILNAQKTQIEYLEMAKQRRQDWLTGLEKIVDKWQTITNKWANTVNRMWTFWNKNWAVNKQLRANSRQIEAQESLLVQNWDEAGKTARGLGWQLRSKIKDGTWDPRSIKDGYLLQQANEYAELRAKVDECRESLQELYDTQRELIKQKIDNIVQYYDDLQGYLDSFTARLESAINLKTAAGQKKSITDILKQYTAAMKTVANQQEKLAKAQTGINPENVRETSVVRAEIANYEGGAKDTAAYKNLVSKIEKLQGKKKLSSKQKKQLQMYMGELDAINEGVASDRLVEFMNAYEKQFNLETKKAKLSSSQAKSLADAIQIQDDIQAEYANTLKDLGRELEDSLISSGELQAESDLSYKREIEDLQETSQNQIDEIVNWHIGGAYEKLLKERDTIQKYLDTGKKGKKKLSSKQKKEYQKQLDALNEQIEAAQYAYVYSVSDIVDAVKVIQKYGNKKKLSNKEAKKLTEAEELLKKAKSSYNEAIEAINRQTEDEIEKAGQDYEQIKADTEKAIDDAKSSSYELVKALAEYQVTMLQELENSINNLISQYKSVTEMLNTVDLKNLQKYGITDFLGLDTSKGATKLLEENLTDAIGSAVERVRNLTQQGDVLRKLIDAAGANDFAEVIEYAKQEAPELADTIEQVISQLDMNDYDNSTWVAEWQESLQKVITDLSTATKEVQDFKNQLREDVLFKAMNNAIKSAEAFKNVYSSIAGIVDENWVIDNTTGQLTQYGVFKAQSLSNELAQAQKQVASYAEMIQKIDEAQANENTAYATEEEYLEARNEAVRQYYSGLESAYQIEHSLYDMMKKAEQAQLDALKKQIDLRKDLLNKKKEYYEYDKQHKQSQRAVDELKAQVEALNNIDTSEAKAQRAQLLAQLKDAEDALADLEQEHIFDLENQAYDDYLQKLQDILDDSNKSIEETFEYFAATVKQLVDIASGADTSQAEQNITDLILGTGHTTPATNLPKETPSVGYNGTYTPLSSSDYVSSIQAVQIDPDTLTSFLRTYDIALTNIQNALLKNIVPDVSTIAKDGGNNANISLNFDKLLEVKGNVDSTVISDLKKFSKDITDDTLSKLFSELKKAGFNVTQH